MNIDALTTYLALGAGDYSGVFRDMYAVHNLGLNPDLHTKLLANRFVGVTEELTGTPPLSFKAKGKPLPAWSITGNTVQDGTPTPENPVEVLGCGERTENLFDGSGVYKTQVGVTIQSLGQYLRINGTKVDGANIISIKDADITLEAGTYTLSVELVSGTVSNSTEGVYFGINRSTYVRRTTPAVRDYGTRGLRTFTLSESTKVTSFDITCGYGDAGAVYTDAAFACMLVKGSTALPYEPYGYKIPVVTSADGTEPITTPIYLPTPLYSGEVLRSDSSREVKWGVVDLGSLTWDNEFDIAQGQIRAANISNPIISTMVYGGNCYCQSYMYDGIKKHTEIKNNSIAFSNSEKIPFLRIKNTSYDNVQDLINSLIGVKLYYELAKPTTETITAPQIPTINGTTVIDVDTAVKPESMTIKYRR